MGYIDVFSTIVEISGYGGTPENDLDGISFLNALKGEKLPDRPWFTYLDQNRDKIERLALNTNEWKLVWQRNAPDNRTHSEQIELFRINDDMTESTDVSENNKDVVKNLQAEIKKYYKIQSENQNPRYNENTILSGPVIPNWQPTK